MEAEAGRKVATDTRCDDRRTGELRIMAVGKRVRHRWLIEMSLVTRPRGTAKTRRAA
jgi:hypothetical protein